MLRIRSRKQLEELRGKTVEEPVMIYGVTGLRSEITSTSEVVLVQVAGDITVTAKNVVVEDCDPIYLGIGAERVSIDRSRIDRLVVKNAESIELRRSMVSSAECGDATDVLISSSHAATVSFNRVRMMVLRQCFIQNLFATEESMAAFGAAIGRTNTRFLDGGTDARGYRVNIFAGHYCPEFGIVIHSSHLDDAEPVTWVTAGCRQLSLPNARLHWATSPMLQVVETAAAQLERRGWIRAGH